MDVRQLPLVRAARTLALSEWAVLILRYGFSSPSAMLARKSSPNVFGSKLAFLPTKLATWPRSAAGANVDAHTSTGGCGFPDASAKGCVMRRTGGASAGSDGTLTDGLVSGTD